MIVGAKVERLEWLAHYKLIIQAPLSIELPLNCCNEFLVMSIEFKQEFSSSVTHVIQPWRNRDPAISSSCTAWQPFLLEPVSMLGRESTSPWRRQPNGNSSATHSSRRAYSPCYWQCYHSETRRAIFSRHVLSIRQDRNSATLSHLLSTYLCPQLAPTTYLQLSPTIQYFGNVASSFTKRANLLHSRSIRIREGY